MTDQQRTDMRECHLHLGHLYLGLIPNNQPAGAPLIDGAAVTTTTTSPTGMTTRHTVGYLIQLGRRRAVAITWPGSRVPQAPRRVLRSHVARRRDGGPMIAYEKGWDGDRRDTMNMEEAVVHDVVRTVVKGKPVSMLPPPSLLVFEEPDTDEGGAKADLYSARPRRPPAGRPEDTR